ncbi:MAG TPA: GNAT family N-acetyltransferase [Gammaproteobacteria bacterium]|nr:GNAT family N-acetyltransferase [Gammaproteobacteria bacterium]
MDGLIPQGRSYRAFPLPILANIPVDPDADSAQLATPELHPLNDWSELAARCKAPPFLHPGWVNHWWPAFGTGKLEINTIWRQEKLAALLPMARRPGQLESTANFHTPVSGMLALDETAAQSLARDLFARAPARVTLTALAPDGLTLPACRSAAKDAGFRVISRPHLESPYADLSGGWEVYRRSRSRQLMRNMRRGRKQLEQMGALRVEKVDGCRPFGEERLEQAFRVEASGWKGKNGSAIQSQPHTLKFYRCMTAWAAQQGVLRLYLLRLDQHVVAMCLTLQQHGVCYMLKGGYDEEFRRSSPGHLLTEAILEDCASREMRRVEMNGEPEAYKLSWATGTDQYLRLEAFAPTAAGQLAWARFRYGRPITRRARQLLRMQQPGHRQ